jgi:glycosyltransferase involved in cell wall biosynthesis
MISVVIPAFNEERAVRATVESVRAILAKIDAGNAEVIVVDDGSSDRTAEEAEGAGARVIRKPQNIGYGHSLKIGIAAAKNDTIVITDADGTYPAESIPDLLAQYRKGFDMVVGSRTGKFYRESWLKAPLRRILQSLVEFTAGRAIPDVNSGLRVFSRKTIMPFFDHLSDAFSFTTSATLAYMLRRKYVEYVPIPYNQRIGSTKVRLFRDSLRTLQYITQAILFYNPLKIFLVLVFALVVGAGVLLLLGLFGFGFASTLAIQCLIAAALLFAIGMLADLIRQMGIRPENRD